MKVYLDNCCFNRPFDEQIQIRISLETQAKLYVQEEIKKGNIQLVWSYILDYENFFNPFEERRRVIQRWKNIAIEDVNENEKIIERSKEIK